MSPFKSNRQRRSFFANNPPPRPPPKLPPSQPPNLGISINPIISKITTSDELIWTGCTIISNECKVIKGVYTAYKMYKKYSLNEQYDNKIEKLIISEIPKFTSAVAEDEIKKVSKEIVNHVNDSGLINNISNITEINENVIKMFMEGTISNLLKDKIEIGTEFLVNNLIL